jgi:MFS family permease
VAGTAVERDDRRLLIRQLFRDRTFLALFLAEAQSNLGDQLARVALSVLVFAQTGSAAATGLTYAATFLPAMLGGLLLSSIGDHLSRPGVMIGCDLVRAGLFAVMGMAGLGIGPTVALLVLAVFLSPVFTASEVSYLANRLDRPQLSTATGLRLTASQLGQVIGFAGGGAVVAVVGARHALLIDGATFLVSAALIAVFVRELPRPVRPPRVERSDGARVIRWCWGHRQMRALLLLSALAGFFVVPEGLAVPFGRATGASTAEIGLLLAAIPLGSSIGALVLVRLVPSNQRVMTAKWMALGCGLPLVVCAVSPPWQVAFACWLLSGALSAYQIEAITSIAHTTPDLDRSRIMGLANASLLGAQGIGLAAFGALARFTNSGISIALAGLIGAICAVALGWKSLRDWSAT